MSPRQLFQGLRRQSLEPEGEGLGATSFSELQGERAQLLNCAVCQFATRKMGINIVAIA